MLEERHLYEGLEDRFLKDLDIWDNLDAEVREQYGYEDFVMGEGKICPGDSPVVCRACARPSELEG